MKRSMFSNVNNFSAKTLIITKFQSKELSILNRKEFLSRRKGTLILKECTMLEQLVKLLTTLSIKRRSMKRNQRDKD